MLSNLFLLQKGIFSYFPIAKITMEVLVRVSAFNFSHDVGEPVTIEQAQNHIEYQIDTKSLYVLELNNQIVSMAARSRSLNTTESVGFVYTPVKLRKNGYARRIVEEVTRKVLNDNKMATLYTDLSNPTSNSIYMKVGYRPYCDSVMLNKF